MLLDATDDILPAVERMLTLRGVRWVEPAREALLGDERLSALTTPGGRLYEAAAAPGPLIVVTALPRVTATLLKHAVDALDQHGIARAQLVARTPVAVPAHQAGRLTVLAWQVVLIRPLDHSLVPPQRRATADDLRLLDEMGVAHRNGSLLPGLTSDDPVAQYLGLAVNDIVRVDRTDGSVYFRRVIAR